MMCENYSGNANDYYDDGRSKNELLICIHETKEKLKLKSERLHEHVESEIVMWTVGLRLL